MVAIAELMGAGAAEIAEKIIRSSIPPEYKLHAICYLPQKIDIGLTSHIAEVLRIFLDDLKYADTKINYPRKQVRLGNQLVAKCRDVSDSPQIIQLCDSIESQIAKIDKHFQSELHE